MKRNLTWYPFLFFLYRDLRRVYIVKAQTIFTPLVTQSLYLLIFGVSLGKVVSISDQFSYLQFIIPGLIALSALNQSFQNGSSSMFGLKITGEIVDVKSTTLNSYQITCACALSGFVRAFIVSFLTFCIGNVFHYLYEGSLMPVHNVGWLLYFVTVSALVFAMLGLSTGIFSKTFDHISAINGFVIAPLIYLGGVFFDLNKLSDFWQTVSVFNPLFYFVNGIRYSILGVSDVPITEAFWYSLVSLVFTYFLTNFLVSKGSFEGI